MKSKINGRAGFDENNNGIFFGFIPTGGGGTDYIHGIRIDWRRGGRGLYKM